jgi:hypothetical protein
MTRRPLAVLLFAASSLQAEGAPPIVVDAALTKAVEQCPIRIVVPVKSWLSGKRKATTFSKTRLVTCDRANVAFVSIEELSDVQNRGRGVAVDPHVLLPGAEDQRITLHVALLDADGAMISEADDDIPGDRGEVNWGADLRLPFLHRDDDVEGILIEVKLRPR